MSLLMHEVGGEELLYWLDRSLGGDNVSLGTHLLCCECFSLEILVNRPQGAVSPDV